MQNPWGSWYKMNPSYEGCLLSGHSFSHVLHAFQLCYWYIFEDGCFLFSNNFCIIPSLSQTCPKWSSWKFRLWLAGVLSEWPASNPLCFLCCVSQWGKEKQMQLGWLCNDKFMQLYHAVITFCFFQNQVSFAWEFLYCQNLSIFYLFRFSLEMLFWNRFGKEQKPS